MAMQNLLSQTHGTSQPASVPPTHPQFIFSSLHKHQPVVDPTVLPAVSAVSQHLHTPLATRLPTSQNFPTISNRLRRTEMAKSTPTRTPSPPQTTAISQIPTSLQRLVQANLSAAPRSVYQPLASSQTSLRGPSPSESPHSSPRGPSPVSSSSSLPATHTTSLTTRPAPLSITGTTGLGGKQTDDLGPTPLTPLSPYCGQQGMQRVLVVCCGQMECFIDVYSLGGPDGLSFVFCLSS